MAMNHSTLTDPLASLFRQARAADDSGDSQQAMQLYRALLARQPDHPASHYHLALNLLRTGDFLQGWREYEWRWKTPGFSAPQRDLGRPLWSGRPNSAERVLLHAEQGFGDTIQFIRLAPLVRARAGQVMLIVPPALYHLAQTAAGIDNVLQNGDPWPEFDSHVPLLSVPFLLALTVDQIPLTVPYLAVDNHKQLQWQQLLQPWQGLKIGLAWQGRPEHEHDARRSCSLEDMQPLLASSGCTFFCLQPGILQDASPTAEQIIDLTADIHDFSDTAALISQLDLIISVDTAVAHLAGALGKSTWLLLPFPAEWRWMDGGEQSVWYPDLRLFRQGPQQSRAAQINDVCQALRDYLSDRHKVAHASALQWPATTPATVPEKSAPVLLDGLFFQYRTSGIARVWQAILEIVSKTADASRFVLLDRAGSFPRIPGFRYLTLPAHCEEDHRHEQALLQQLCDQEGAALFISTWHSSPLTTPSLLMLHDMIPELMLPREEFDATPRWQEKKAAIRQATAYLAVSGTTAADFRRFYPDCAARPLHVVHNGVATSFLPENQAKIHSFCQPYGVSGGYWLFVGPRQSYKNFRLLLDAWLLLTPEDQLPILATAYPILEPEFAGHPAATAVICTRQLTDTELSAAYSGATALIYPSRYEGFGLPLLEAMACGCPVICSSAPALVEVAGEAALIVPPDAPERLAAAMFLLRQNEAVRNRQIIRGVKRASIFTWEQATARFLGSINEFKNT